MSQERVTILIAGENPADLEKIAICLRAEGFKGANGIGPDSYHNACTL
jgi:hypothetical protein